MVLSGLWEQQKEDHNYCKPNTVNMIYKIKVHVRYSRTKTLFSP